MLKERLQSSAACIAAVQQRIGLHYRCAQQQYDRFSGMLVGCG
jgi:hypothetical protein